MQGDNSFIAHEKNKARDLRKSQWWKRKCSKGLCGYCGKNVSPKKLTMDHIVPISRGGRTTRGNVKPACKSCNTKKKTMLTFEWQEYIDSQKNGKSCL
ncbi:HNH endonuclease [Candidatus Magnetomorum sp. HK-1]|nr:HNH endonuclease [Candidatus Magnetomorum sp. HK-1]